MYTMIATCKPKSVNSSRRDRYKNNLASEFEKYNPSYKPYSQKSYTKVYYFHSTLSNIDADNLSKPVVDSLNNKAYKDDKFVVFRECAKFDLSSNDISEIDLTNIANNFLDDFLTAIDNEDHIIYVEVGKFSLNQIEFGGVSFDPE